MSTGSNKRIIILPFISSKLSPEISELEAMLIQGIEYKLSPITAINLIDFHHKTFPSSVHVTDGNYTIKDLLLIAAKYDAKYALIGKFIDNEDDISFKINFKLYNMQISQEIETWESPKELIMHNDDELIVTLEQFNLFLRDSATVIINKMDFDLNENLTKYLNFKVTNDIYAFTKLCKATKITKWIDEKLTLLEESINLDQKSEHAYAEIAKILKNSRKYEQAISNYKSAIDKGANNYLKALYSNELGLCYSLNNNFQESLASWENAIEFDNSYINPYMNIAIAYEGKGAYVKAEQYFLDIQKLAPNDCRTYFNLARLYSKTGNWLKAIDQYKYQLNVNPYDAWSHSNIANCYLQINQPKEAKTFLYKTIDLDPDGEAGNFAKQILETMEESTKRDWWKFWKK